MFGNNAWPTCSKRPGDSSLADLAERAGVVQVWRTWLKGPGSSKSVNQVQGSAAESPGNYGRFLMRRGRSPWETETEATTAVRLRRIEENESCPLSQALATPVDEIIGVDGVGPAQRVSSGAAMPSVPKRPGAQEGQRSAGKRCQLRDDRARLAG